MRVMESQNLLKELLEIIDDALPGQSPVTALVKLKLKIKAALPKPIMPEQLVKDVNNVLQGLETTEDAISIKAQELEIIIEEYNRKVDAWQNVAICVNAWRRSVGLGLEELDLDIERIDASISSIAPYNEHQAIRRIIGLDTGVEYP